MPRRQSAEAVKMRRLKKADFEADFFFMELGLNSALRHLNATARYVDSVLLSPPAMCQDHSFRFMEIFRNTEELTGNSRGSLASSHLANQ